MLSKADLSRKQFKRSELKRREIIYEIPLVESPFKLRKDLIIHGDIFAEAISKCLDTRGEDREKIFKKVIDAGFGNSIKSSRASLYNLRTRIQGFKDFLIRYSIGRGEVKVVAYFPVLEDGKASSRYIYSVIDLGDHKTITKSKKICLDKHPAEILIDKSVIDVEIENCDLFELLNHPDYKQLQQYCNEYYSFRNQQFDSKVADREHNTNINIVLRLYKQGKVKIVEDVPEFKTST